MRLLKMIKASKVITAPETPEPPLDINEPIYSKHDGTTLSFGQSFTKYGVGDLVARAKDVTDARDILGKIAKLLCEVRFEIMYAEQNGDVVGKNHWENMADMLEEQYKILNTMCMGFGTEAKFLGL